MLPSFKQRLIIAAATILGGLMLRLAASALGASDASPGISLFDAKVGLILAVLCVVVVALPTLAMAAVTAAAGHVLSGVFVLAVAMSFLAAAGGQMDGYFWRHAMPSGYVKLMAELVLWAAGWIGVLAVLRWSRPRLRPYLGKLRSEEHWGDELKLNRPDWRSLVAGGISMCVGGLLAHLLIQNTDDGQVIGSLLLAFTIGGMLGKMIMPHEIPLPVLLSPLAAAVLGYGYAAVSFGDAVTPAWFAGNLTGLALALPIFVASAGVAGSAMGIGLAQSLDRARVEAAEAAQAAA